MTTFFKGIFRFNVESAPQNNRKKKKTVDPKIIQGSRGITQYNIKKI